MHLDQPLGSGAEHRETVVGSHEIGLGRRGLLQHNIFIGVELGDSERQAEIGGPIRRHPIRVRIDCFGSDQHGVYRSAHALCGLRLGTCNERIGTTVLGHVVLPHAPRRGHDPHTIGRRLAPRRRRTVRVYDVTGMLVAPLADREYDAGAHAVTWDGTDRTGAGVTSGVYFYRITAGVDGATRQDGPAPNNRDSMCPDYGPTTICGGGLWPCTNLLPMKTA